MVGCKPLQPLPSTKYSAPPQRRVSPLEPTPRQRQSQQNADDPRQKRIDQAVDFCADVLADGWEDAVASRAADCLTPQTWNKLFRGRRQGDCKVLARLAKAMLDGKKQLHGLVGTAGGWVAGHIFGEGLERKVAKEMAERIPIPFIDQKAAIIARGLQMIGISLCLGQGIPLNRCQCFIDLSLAESKEQVQRMCADALKDWTKPDAELLATWGHRHQ